MIKYLPFLLLMGCGIPKAQTPTEISAWAKCDPANIAYWVGQHEYKVHTGWMTSRECIFLGEWDCKCSATIAKDTLNACGFEARVQTLKHRDKHHAVALYTDTKGNRGFIDSHKYGEFGHVPWQDVIDRIGGGPWVITP